MTQYGERGSLLVRLAGKKANAGDEAGPPIQPEIQRTLDWCGCGSRLGTGKPAEDVVADIGPGVLLSVDWRPQAVDGLRWWLCAR